MFKIYQYSIVNFVEMCTIFEGTDVFLQWNEKGLASKDKVKIAKCEI